MKNVKNFREFLNENRVEKRLASLDAEYTIDKKLCKQLMDVGEQIDYIYNNLDLPHSDFATSNFIPPEIENDDKTASDWVESEKALIRSELKSKESEYKKILRKIQSKHSYINDVIEYLNQTNLGFTLENTFIDKINRRNDIINTVVIKSWYGYAKASRKELERYKITPEQLAGTILSMRAVADELTY